MSERKRMRLSDPPYSKSTLKRRRKTGVTALAAPRRGTGEGIETRQKARRRRRRGEGETKGSERADEETGSDGDSASSGSKRDEEYIFSSDERQSETDDDIVSERSEDIRFSNEFRNEARDDGNIGELDEEDVNSNGVGGSTVAETDEGEEEDMMESNCGKDSDSFDSETQSNSKKDTDSDVGGSTVAETDEGEEEDMMESNSRKDCDSFDSETQSNSGKDTDSDVGSETESNDEENGGSSSGDDFRNLSPDDYFDLDKLAEPVCENHHASLGESVLILETLFLRHSNSYAEQQSTLDTINFFLGRTSILPKTTDDLKNIFRPVLHDTINYYFYCSFCTNIIGQFKKIEIKNQPVSCELCQTVNNISCKYKKFYVIMNLQTKFRCFLSVHSRVIMENEAARRKPYTGEINDIYDGSMYRKLKENGQILSQEFNFSVSMNVDGASFFESSNTSCWPIQLMFNELPPSVRFRNIILAGVWFGKELSAKNGDMGLFLKPFVEEMKLLAQEGVTWVDHLGVNHTSKIVLISVPVDSPARAKVMNMKSFNGYFGCPRCLDPGMELAGAHRFPYSVVIDGERINRVFEKRTHESAVEAMKEASRIGQLEYGFKGLSALFGVPYIDLVKGFPIETLHCIDIGTFGRSFLDAVLNDTHEPYYIGTPNKLKRLNNRLALLKVPEEIHRLPRDFSKTSSWKATEYKYLMFHSGYPIFEDVLPDKYLNHLGYLIEARTLLNKEKITEEDIRQSSELMELFAAGICILYGERYALFNVHVCLHLPDTIEESGPEWANNVACFESNMLTFKNCVHGSNGVEQQIVDRIVIKDSLPLLQKRINISPETELLLRKMSSRIPENRSCYRADDCVIFGSAFQLEDSDLLALQESGIATNRAVKHAKIIHSGRVLTSSSYNPKGRRDNSYVFLNPLDYGRIRSIIVREGQVYIILETLLSRPVTYQPRRTFSNIRKVDVRLNNEFTVVRPTDIKQKAVFIKTTREKAYISALLTTGEVQ